MSETVIKNRVNESYPWIRLFQDGTFEQWKNLKKKVFIYVNAAPPTVVDSLENCDSDSVSRMKEHCSQVNFAVYEAKAADLSVAETGKALIKFAANFGLKLREDHRSAAENGVVALTPSSEKSKKGYIPYTPRALNWHTDGYYNSPDNQIKGFFLHCYRPAEAGGENELIDPEIALMRLYEADPSMLEAFFHPEAMTIPANVEPNAKVRPPSVGPVFFFDDKSGRLQMRYTARTRSIEWRDDPATQDAAAWMHEWLESDDPYKVRIRLKAGQGILNNNVLHNRTGFDDDPSSESKRTMLRVRFHDRAEEK